MNYFVLALRRTVRKLRHASNFSSTLIVYEGYYYAYKSSNSGRSAQYRPKSSIMTDSRCLRHFQWSWRIAQISEAK